MLDLKGYANQIIIIIYCLMLLIMILIE